jgi:hypothetical protein
VEGTTVHAFLSREGKIVRAPARVADIFAALQAP